MTKALNHIVFTTISFSFLTNCMELKNTQGAGTHTQETTLTSTSSVEAVTSTSSGEAVTGSVSGGTDSSSGSDGGDSQASEVTSDCSIATEDTSDSSSLACNPWEQDCPECQKCLPAINDGGEQFDTTKCVPLAANPAHVGEACLASGAVGKGTDNCAIGSMCWYVDGGGVGVCVSLCGGDPNSPKCNEGTLCVVGGEFINLCIEECNPLVYTCSQAGSLCVSYYLSGFICFPDSWPVPKPKYSPCEEDEQCDFGNGCFNVLTSPQCDQGASGCCMPFCDMDQPGNLCSVEDGEKCAPYFEEGVAPEGYENLGVCSALP